MPLLTEKIAILYLGPSLALGILLAVILRYTLKRWSEDGPGCFYYTAAFLIAFGLVAIVEALFTDILIGIPALGIGIGLLAGGVYLLFLVLSGWWWDIIPK